LKEISDRGDTLSQEVASILSANLQLHEYGLLAALSKASPGSVSGSRLRRSMSCLECWFADLYNKGCAASLPCEMYLIPCWEQFESFQFRPMQDDDAVLMCPAPEPAQTPSVADAVTFCQRFASRTGGLFDDINWSNMVVIGGMVLGCLTCDDASFRELFSEADVDVYLVGVSGQDFRDRVASIIASLSNKVMNTCSVLRTAQSITLVPGTEVHGWKLPNVQIILTPYRSVAHLLFTTDIDCTAMGFDGSRLLATPRAREALATRRNIVRPEKYMVRGEWRTEARYLKYAARGFRAVDLGLTPTAAAIANGDLVAQLQNTTQQLEAANEVVNNHLRTSAEVRAERAAARNRAEQVGRQLWVAASLLVGDWVTSDGLSIRLQRSSAHPDDHQLEGLVANMPPTRHRRDGRFGEVVSEGAVHAGVVWSMGDDDWNKNAFRLSFAQGGAKPLSLAMDIFVDKDSFLEQVHREGETEDLGQYDALRSARPDLDMNQALQAMVEQVEQVGGDASPVEELWWKVDRGYTGYTGYTNGYRSRSPPPVRWTRAPKRFPDELFEPLPSRRWEPWRPSPYNEDDAAVEAEVGDDEMQSSLEALHLRQQMVQQLSQKVVGTFGVYGARLLLLAKELPALAALLVWEMPLLRAGLDRDEVVDILVYVCSAEAQGKADEVEYDGSYGQERSRLVLVNPLPGQERRERFSFRSREMDFRTAIEEKDLESDRFETRGWYDGLPVEDLLEEFSTMDTAVWRGIGDFRAAA